MTADGTTRTVDPIVIHGINPLVEGRDYIITGTVDYTVGGTYSRCIQGINGYTGQVVRSYTVAQGQLTGDVDGSGKVDSDDAIYLLYHTLFSESYPVTQDCDFNGSGAVNSDDAIHLLYHALFGDALYPLS